MHTCEVKAWWQMMALLKGKFCHCHGSVILAFFSIWKSLQSFIFCSALSLTVAFDNWTNVQSSQANPVLQKVPSSLGDFLFLSRLQKTARSPATMIHRLCSICELRYCSNGCPNVISAVGSVVQSPLSGLWAHCWNMVLSISGGCNVNMLFCYQSELLYWWD